LTATVHSESDVLSGELVSGNYFPLLGINAAAGRVFNSNDDLHPNAHPVAVLSYACWKNRFTGSDRVVGSTILVNNYSLTVIGVSQPGFSGLEPGLPTQIFVPVMMTPKLFPHDDFSEMFDFSTALGERFRAIETGNETRQRESGIAAVVPPHSGERGRAAGVCARNALRERAISENVA